MLNILHIKEFENILVIFKLFSKISLLQTFGDKSLLIDYSKLEKYDFSDLNDEITKLL